MNQFDIEKSQRDFMQAVDRSVAKHDELLSLSEWQSIEAEETAFEPRVTWVAITVVLAVAVFAAFI